MDPTLLTLRDEAIKTEQAVENANEKKESEKVKLESIYKLLNKTEDELNSIYLEIESDRKNTGVPLDKEYNDSYWKWKDAVAVNEIAQTKLKKYQTNMNAGIPEVMIELKEVKNEMQRQNEELKNEVKEVQQQNHDLKNEVKQQIVEMKNKMQRQNEELKTQKEELKNEVKEVQQQNHDLKKEVKQQNEEMQRQNEELKNVMQRQNEKMMNKLEKENEELKTQNEELKNEMQQMKTMLPEMMMQQNKEMMQVLKKLSFLYDEGSQRLLQYGQPFTGSTIFTFPNGDQFEGDFQDGKPHQGRMTLANGDHVVLKNITPAFNGQNKEVDIVFPEPVEARSITFKPKSWKDYPYLRCDVYVDGVLQTTPLSQRTASSYESNSEKDSTMNASNGWCHKDPYNPNQWLKLDLQQRKTITGIRVGTYGYDASVYVSKFALEFGN